MSKVVFFSNYQPAVIDIIVKAAPPDFNVIVKDFDISEEEKIAIVEDADFVLLHRKSLSEKVLRAATRLKLLQLTAAGYETVDLPLMARLGISVANVGGANSMGVAEMAITLMLAVYRRLIQLDSGVRNGKWRKELISGFDTFELAEKAVGIVGFGNIGNLVARRLSGFDCKILYHDIVAYPETETQLKAERVDLVQLLRQADVVTLHAPLTNNRHLIGKTELSLMRSSAILINTARGAMVDEAALINALKDGRIAGAGLDVFQREPVDACNELLTMENVVLTPHAAGSTYESWDRRARFVYQNFQRVLKGKVPLSLVRAKPGTI